jgi:AcrR family transcriptional regulator
VDPALIRRFFGGKEDLFTAVASAVVDPASALTALTSGPEDQAGERLLRYFLGLLGDVKRPGPLLGLIRSAMTSEHAADVMRTFLAERILRGIAETLHADQAELRAALVHAQLVGIAVTRYAIRLAPLTATSDDELVALVAPVLQHYFTAEHITMGKP